MDTRSHENHSIASWRFCEDRAMTEDQVERRGYLRVEVFLDELQVTVGVLGFEPANGVVLNVSHGGMKVSLNREISELLVGNDCLVRFVEGGGRVNPEAMLGKAGVRGAWQPRAPVHDPGGDHPAA